MKFVYLSALLLAAALPRAAQATDDSFEQAFQSADDTRLKTDILLGTAGATTAVVGAFVNPDYEDGRAVKLSGELSERMAAEEFKANREKILKEIDEAHAKALEYHAAVTPKNGPGSLDPKPEKMTELQWRARRAAEIKSSLLYSIERENLPRALIQKHFGESLETITARKAATARTLFGVGGSAVAAYSVVDAFGRIRKLNQGSDPGYSPAIVSASGAGVKKEPKAAVPAAESGGASTSMDIN